MIKIITSDIDHKSKINLIYYLAKGIFKIDFERIEIRKSESKGYHLMFITKKQYNKKQIETLRYQIGDDKNRIRIDRRKKIGKQTLFHFKFNPKILEKKNLKSGIISPLFYPKMKI